MTGSITDNSTRETPTGGEETTSVDLTNSEVNENKATEEGLFAGFDDDSAGDGSTPPDSNSTEEVRNGKKTNEQTETDAQAKPEEGETGKRSGRPDKRQRQIDSLLAAKAEKEAELARLRELERQTSSAQLPEADADGNISIDNMVEYQKQLAREEAKAQLTEYQQRVEAAERERDIESTLADVGRIVDTARNKFKVLNPGDASFNPKVDAFVRDRIEEALTPIMAAGAKDLRAVAATVGEAIESSMEFYQHAAEQAALSTQSNLSALKSQSALVGVETGNSSPTKDAFEAAFDAEDE
jgi:hypothetical protein